MKKVISFFVCLVAVVCFINVTATAKGKVQTCNCITVQNQNILQTVQGNETFNCLIGQRVINNYSPSDICNINAFMQNNDQLATTGNATVEKCATLTTSFVGNTNLKDIGINTADVLHPNNFKIDASVNLGISHNFDTGNIANAGYLKNVYLVNVLNSNRRIYT